MCGRAEEGAAELREALRLGADEATVYSSMRAVYDDAGEKEKAGECRLKAESAGSRSLKIARARERMDEGRPAEALKEAGRALQLDPDDAEANTIKGAALARMGRFRASIKPLQKAALARPDSAHAHIHLGESLASDGDSEGALRHFEAAVRLEPGDAGGTAARATCWPAWEGSGRPTRRTSAPPAWRLPGRPMPTWPWR